MASISLSSSRRRKSFSVLGALRPAFSTAFIGLAKLASSMSQRATTSEPGLSENSDVSPAPRSRTPITATRTRSLGAYAQAREVVTARAPAAPRNVRRSMPVIVSPYLLGRRRIVFNGDRQVLRARRDAGAPQVSSLEDPN